MKDTSAQILANNFNNQQIDLLKEYPNQVLLVIIYNNQCLGCTGRAIPLAYQFKKENSNLQVIGIHSNFNDLPVSEAEIKSIFTIDELPFPIYIDPGHKVYDQFNSEGTPQWLIINKDGSLYRSVFGSQENAQNRLAYALESLGL